MSIKIGPSGNSDSFYEQGFKSSLQMPKWLKSLGLNAYEYQCSKGVNINEDMARKLGEEAVANEIQISIHAPYFISLSSVEPEKRQNSIKYIIDTLVAARQMNATRIVVHSGSASKISRENALGLAKETLQTAINAAREQRLGDIHICPETMGKINQLGTIEEVVELCKIDDNLLPTVDFGHLHARGLGCLNKYEDYLYIFDTIEKYLGIDRLKNFHIHYSRIEFTAGGEKKHWTFEDKEYGPEFEPIAEIIYKKNLSPTIICESRGKMAEDAIKLKEIYENLNLSK